MPFTCACRVAGSGDCIMRDGAVHPKTSSGCCSRYRIWAVRGVSSASALSVAPDAAQSPLASVGTPGAAGSGAGCAFFTVLDGRRAVLAGAADAGAAFLAVWTAGAGGLLRALLAAGAAPPDTRPWPGAWGRRVAPRLASRARGGGRGRRLGVFVRRLGVLEEQAGGGGRAPEGVHVGCVRDLDSESEDGP